MWMLRGGQILQTIQMLFVNLDTAKGSQPNIKQAEQIYDRHTSICSCVNFLQLDQKP